jgi:hypothetical protein
MSVDQILFLVALVCGIVSIIDAPHSRIWAGLGIAALAIGLLI